MPTYSAQATDNHVEEKAALVIEMCRGFPQAMLTPEMRQGYADACVDVDMETVRRVCEDVRQGRDDRPNMDYPPSTARFGNYMSKVRNEAAARQRKTSEAARQVQELKNAGQTSPEVLEKRRARVSEIKQLTDSWRSDAGIPDAVRVQPFFVKPRPWTDNCEVFAERVSNEGFRNGALKKKWPVGAKWDWRTQQVLIPRLAS